MREHKNSKKLKIGILDVCGNGNLGDEAIQQAMIQNILKYIPNGEIYGFSCNPTDTLERHGIESFPISKFGDREQWWLGKNPSYLSKLFFEYYRKLETFPNNSVKKAGRLLLGFFLEMFASIRAYKNLREIDMLIVSGGGQLDDDYWGAWFEPYILFFWGVLSRLSNTKFAVVSVGVGNISSHLSRFFIKTGLSLACYRSYRDSKSKNYLNDLLNYKNDDPVYPDLAYSLDLSQYQDLSPENSHHVIAINPIWFIPGYWSGKSSSKYCGLTDNLLYQDYLTKLVEFIIWLLKNDFKVIIFSSCIGEGLEIGEKLLEDISSKYESGFLKEQVVIPSILTVDDLVTQLSEVSLVVASRLHSILLSFLLNKPTIALSYHFKVDKLMEETAQEEYCLRVDKFSLDDLKDQFLALKERQECIKDQLLRAESNAKISLSKQYEYLFKELLNS